MTTRRVDRINGQLRQELSLIISRQIKDPRIGGVITITQVKAAHDLRTARVFVSVLGDQATKLSTLEGIQSASTYLRRELRDRLKLKYVPFMKFELDQSIEDADNLLRVIDQLKDDPAMEKLSAHIPTNEGPLAFPSNNK
ncbi:MAG: 30S ribosome-binding factor RbfA [Chloroflexi bacterium]|nr:30S ribosome-binding factor RbfA [Chloroflexota bacterium]MDA1218462.1 30S ribosome-binding factor RbfA [Chloroflexota bacterium]PKB56843.1 MAG: ribosome-binding factor A [SAR202 cluster bacterium Casp-Chloro-G3]